ncbi:MAG: hypothetical protein SGI92_11155, partial [Bryobacteraceae bacterium]|nr:hypothetical protein [Bryobacteraceae bacterium]
PDPRVRHYYDPDRKLSARFGGVARLPSLAAQSELAFKMKDVIWDAALLYPPAATLDAQATLLLAPVMKFQTRLADTLGANRRN